VTGGIPPQDLHFATFQPTFLYELIWDLALAVFLVWLGHHARIRPWGLFALYVAGYSAFRIFEESAGRRRWRRRHVTCTARCCAGSWAPTRHRP
jgi:prolipoprotein diacylglyceryltransferase